VTMYDYTRQSNPVDLSIWCRFDSQSSSCGLPAAAIALPTGARCRGDSASLVGKRGSRRRHRRGGDAGLAHDGSDGTASMLEFRLNVKGRAVVQRERCFSVRFAKGCLCCFREDMWQETQVVLAQAHADGVGGLVAVVPKQKRINKKVVLVQY
jgi:hypothetical protein